MVTLLPKPAAFVKKPNKEYNGNILEWRKHKYERERQSGGRGRERIP